MKDKGSRVWRLGFRFWGLWIVVWVLGSRVECLGLDFGIRVSGSRLRV